MPKNQPAPKVKPVSPLHNAQRVPLNTMLEELSRRSGMSKKDQTNKFLEMQLGPRRELTNK